MAINTFREDEKIDHSINLNVLFRLLSYLKNYKKSVLFAMLLMLIAVTVNIINPYFIKIGIDEYISENNTQGLIALGGIMIVVNSISMIASKKRINLMGVTSNKILMEIRESLFNHIQKLSFSFFDSRPVGKILARITTDVNALTNFFTDSVTVVIPDIITLLAISGIMFWMNYQLALAAFVMLPLLMGGLAFIERTFSKKWQVFRKKNSNLNAYIHEDYSGIRVVQSFAKENETSHTFFDLGRQLNHAFTSAIRYANGFWSMVVLSWGLGTAVVFWAGVRLIERGEISIGVLVAFMGYITMFWRPVMNLTNFYNITVSNMTSAERIFEILDTPPGIVDEHNAKMLPPIQGQVSFQNVSFSYDREERVLDGVSFDVKQGETIALVGHTGAGKTTIINLLSRFYDLQEGKITIDGHDISKATMDSLRSQMAVMMQDTFLFSGTVKDNIRYGKPDASDEEIIHAAKAVNAHPFIMTLEKGYDTEINERGSKLSIGQRQLLALSRAVLNDPRILILDEATSSIDTETELLVQEGIEKLLKDRTSFVIAHRLSTIKKADRIMVIHDGKILETGSHDELLKNRSMYYKLFAAQFQFLTSS